MLAGTIPSRAESPAAVRAAARPAQAPSRVETSTQAAAEETARRMEAALGAVKTLRADFQQTYYSMAAPEPLREKGVFTFQKPDSMRWEYQSPEKNVFLYAGGTFKFYIAEENQLIVSRESRDRDQAQVLDLFTGARRLADVYAVEATAFPTGDKDAAQVRLTPREEGDTAYLLVEVGRGDALPRRVIAFDWAGNRQEFVFSRLKTGLRFPPGQFDFTPPPGCEIVRQDDIIKQ